MEDETFFAVYGIYVCTKKKQSIIYEQNGMSRKIQYHHASSYIMCLHLMAFKVKANNVQFEVAALVL